MQRGGHGQRARHRIHRATGPNIGRTLTFYHVASPSGKVVILTAFRGNAVGCFHRELQSVEGHQRARIYGLGRPAARARPARAALPARKSQPRAAHEKCRRGDDNQNGNQILHRYTNKRIPS